MCDLAELKAALPDYLTRVGARIIRRSARQLQVLCPLHEDTEPSFSATLKDDGVWLWHCHACGIGGTVIDLHARLHGLRPRGHAAITGAAEILGMPLAESGKLTQAQRRAHRDRRVARIEREARERRHQARDQRITAALRVKREAILAAYLSDEWRADLWHDSPLIPPAGETEQARALITHLYAPGDILWTGDICDSGKSRHAANFRPSRAQSNAIIFSPRIAPGIFREGSTSRTAGNVIRRPFLIIESDELIGRKPTNPGEREANKRLSAALFGLLRHKFHLTLRAVVDTGGKSLHGWFDRPSDRAVTGLTRLTEGLAIDRQLLDRAAAAPLRLPGCVHDATGTPARLLYLNPASTA